MGILSPLPRWSREAREAGRLPCMCGHYAKENVTCRGLFMCHLLHFQIKGKLNNHGDAVEEFDKVPSTELFIGVLT